MEEPQYSLQDVIRCDLCEAPVPLKHCDMCHMNLCSACVVSHLSDGKTHKVVPFKMRGSTPKCLKHFPNLCELYCKQCSIPVCSSCISSGQHDHHKIVNILKILSERKNRMQKDLKELEKSIYPQYQEIASKISVQIADQQKHSEGLITAVRKQGEALHQEVDAAIQRMTSDIEVMGSRYMVAIQRQELEVNRTIDEIQQILLDLRKLMDSTDACLVAKYQSRNEEFRSLPAQFQVTLPTFTPHVFNREQIDHHVGFLSELKITYPARPFITEPRIISNISIEFGTDKSKHNAFLSVSCLSDSKFWTCGYDDKIMRLYNLQGELVKSVQTISGNMPYDIAVTGNNTLVYTDYTDKSKKIVGDTEIQPLIKLDGWIPLRVCSSSSGDLLVIIMDSDDDTQSRAVSYSGSTQKQTIQWDDQGYPFYTSGHNKYISENINWDICVVDCGVRAIVVVSAAGKLRFRYTGPTSTTEESFDPLDITTDSQGNILITDFYNQRIHILDQNGHFLRYIDNCGLDCPWGLCVDSRDSLFVAEYRTGKVKKIQYYE